jgi:hypothetical protein
MYKFVNCEEKLDMKLKYGKSDRSGGMFQLIKAQLKDGNTVTCGAVS